MRRLTLSLFLVLSLVSGAFAQEMWGMVNSNFAGNTGVDINPSTLVGMPMTSEFHLISGDIFVYNNYVYLPPSYFALGNIVTGDLGRDVLRDRYIDDPIKTAYFNMSFKGPSFLWSKNTWGLSIHTALRNHLSADNYPYHIAKFNWEGVDYTPQHNQWYVNDNIHATGMSYGELGISFGKSIIQSSDNILSAGISLKRLIGFNSMFVQIDNISYNIPVQELLLVDRLNMDYGHALADYESDATSNPFKVRGTGWGTNFGVSYQHGRNERGFSKTARKYEPIKKYDFRVGFSVMDVGSINWKEDARRFLFEEASTIWPGFDTVSFDDLTYADSIISVQFTGDAEQSLIANEYRTFLPSAFSTQIDIAINPTIYVNLSVVKGFRLNKPAVRRPDQISVTARYETRYLEIAIPYSWYDFERHRIGIAVRYGPFLLGSDRVLAFTGLGETDGIDFYFALKWAFYNGRRGGNRTKCFAF